MARGGGGHGLPLLRSHVVIRGGPGKSYSEVLREARSTVSLNAVGIMEIEVSLNGSVPRGPLAAHGSGASGGVQAFPSGDEKGSRGCSKEEHPGAPST